MTSDEAISLMKISYEWQRWVYTEISAGRVPKPKNEIEAAYIKRIAGFVRDDKATEISK